MAGKLTTHVIESAKVPSDGQAFLWDGELKGFGVRIGSTGVKSYVLQYRSPDGRLPWPEMPETFRCLPEQAAEVAGYARLKPDSCLMNRYEPGSRLSLHQDRNERDYDAPIVSVSLGLPAIFLWGGATRSEKSMRVRLFHGDVVVWGGPARLTFHRVDTLRGSGDLAGEFATT